LNYDTASLFFLPPEHQLSCENLTLTTNAFTRERDKWGNITQDLDTETKFMSDWYGSQFDKLDNYIGNL